MSRKRWYEFRAASQAGPPTLYLYSEIGAFGVSASDFSRDLQGLGRVKALSVHINSAGGNVFDGLAIHNMLARHGARITVYVDGVAASIASLIAMAGDEIIMPANALMMIHDPAGGGMGTARDMRDLADILDKIRDSMVGTYSDRTGLDADEVRALMEAETWMDAAEAVDKGFADRIEDAMEIAASVDLHTFKNAPAPSWRPDNEDEMTTTPSKKGGEGAAETQEELTARLTAELTEKVTKDVEAKMAAAAAEKDKTDAQKAVDAATAKARADAADLAKNISATCKLAGHPEMAGDFIAAGKTLAEVTAELEAAKEKDGKAEVSARHSVHPDGQAQEPAAKIDSTKIYARYNDPKAKRRAA